MFKDYEYKVISTIKNLRKQKGITQEQMAFEINISTSFLGMIERGERNLSLKIIYKIAGFFEMKPSEFLYLVENK